MPRKDLQKRKEYAKEYRNRKRAFVNKISSEWNKKNPEKAKKIQKDYRERNREKVRMAQKKWATENPNKQKDAVKNWARLNTNKIREYSRKRRNSKFNAKGFHTQGEWELLKRQYGFICQSCNKSEPIIKLTEDHIIPLSKGGTDYIDNIQPLCGSCNCKKHTKIINYGKNL